MAARHEWKHNWIPLTPAAALVKAKGSKTTAAKLRARHGVKSSSTRDVVRASRQTSMTDPPRRSESTLAREARMAEKAGAPIGATVDARQPGIEKVTRGKVVGRDANGMLKVEYTDRRGDTVVGTFNPAHTTVVGSKPAATSAPHTLKPGDTATVRGVDASGQPITLTGVVDGNTEQTIYKRGRKTGGEPVRAIALKREGASGMTRTDVVYVPDPDRGEQSRGDDLAAARARRASEQSARAAELRDRAAAERAKLQGIADRAGPPTTDPQANRLSARGLKQAHRNTDSSLRRFTETQQRANALESQAHLADARAKEAGRTRLTRADVEGATHIVDQHGQPREVVRVNAKTITVKTPYSWTETVPIDKVRRAIKASPEQIAEARRRAALRK